MLAGSDCNDYARKELRSAPCYVAVPQRYRVERARVNGDNFPSHELPLNVVWRTYSDSHDRQIDSIGTCIYSISGPSRPLGGWGSCSTPFSGSLEGAGC